LKNFKFIILFLVIGLVNCERDDICAASTETTPRLLIEFYDITNPEELKNVPRLTLYGEGLVTDENGDPTEPTIFTDATIVFNLNTNAVALPLKIDTETTETAITTTRYILEKDTNLRLDETGESNKDILQISYETEFVYVSRACGYKSIFKNLNVTQINDGDNWTSLPITDVTTIENENTVHVRINH
jgi:hypothetical protein